MSFKWDGNFKKVEEANDWAWWALFGAVILMEVIAILKMSGKI